MSVTRRWLIAVSVTLVFIAPGMANFAVGTSGDGNVSVQVATDTEQAAPDEEVNVTITSVGVGGPNMAEPYSPEDDEDTENATAPSNTAQSPRTKNVQINGMYVHVDDQDEPRKLKRKIKLSVTVTLTCTWNAGEGKWDVVAAVTAVTYTPQCRKPAAAGGGGKPANPGNMNGDGNADHCSIDDSTLFVELSDGLGGLLPPDEYSLPTGPYAITTGDLDDDGRTDIVVSASGGAQVRVFMNDGFGAFAATDLLLASGAPEDVAAHDYDADGDLDLLVSSPTTDRILLYENDGTGGFALDGHLTIVGHEAPNDHIQFLQQASDDDFEWAVLTNTGTTGKIRIYDGTSLETTIMIGDTVEEFGNADFDDEGARDIAAWCADENAIVVALGDSAGSYSTTTYDITQGTITQFSFKDVDSDEDIDIVVETTGGTATLTNDGTGSFTVG